MWLRFTRFNAVSAVGFAVQLAVLSLLVQTMGVHYLPATALAVTVAVIHNFVWHVSWTWADREASRRERRQTFLRFAFGNGAVSLIGNTLVMAVLVGAAGVAPVPANIAAIACCGVVNFVLADRFVF